jgi:hypothetical protein
MKCDLEQVVKKKKSTAFLSRIFLRLALLLVIIGAGRFVCDHLVNESYNTIPEDELKHYLNARVRALIAEPLTDRQYKEKLSYLLNNAEKEYKAYKRGE